MSKAQTQDSAFIIGYFPLFYPQPKMQQITNINQVEPFIDSLDIPPHTTMGCIWAYANDCLQPIIICENAEQIAQHLKYYSDQQPEQWFQWFTTSDDITYTIGLMPNINQIIDRFKTRYNYVDDAKHQVLYSPLKVDCPMSDHYELFIKQVKKHKSIKISLIDYEHAHKYKTLEEVKDEHIFVLGEFSRTSIKSKQQKNTSSDHEKPPS